MLDVDATQEQAMKGPTASVKDLLQVSEVGGKLDPQIISQKTKRHARTLHTPISCGSQGWCKRPEQAEEGSQSKAGQPWRAEAA